MRIVIEYVSLWDMGKFVFDDDCAYIGKTDNQILECLFTRFNGMEEWPEDDTVLQRYYAAGFPSMSVGFVVSLGGNNDLRTYECMSHGWMKI